MLALATPAALAGCGGGEEPVVDATPDAPGAVPAPAVDLPAPGAARTVLLAGLDRRFADGPGARTRSDTMLLLRLDPRAPATAMLSLPRDLRVRALGRPDRDKLNQAWFQGGGRRLSEIVGTAVLGTEDEPFVVDDVLSVRFGTFAKIVNALGCLYADVDRRYLVPPGAGHAEIDQPAGYARLCGEDALAYVRYRIGDSDFVREARQAHFLTEARTQIDPLAVLDGDLLPRLARLIGKDAQTREELTELVQLAIHVVGRPTARVEIDGLRDATDGSGDVLASRAALRRARDRFLDPRLPAQKTPVEERTGRPAVLPVRGRRLRTSAPASLRRDAAGARGIARRVARGAPGLAVLVPDLRPASARYDRAASRGYRIAGARGRGGWPAYRVVARTATGQAYGIQGTTWRAPPALGLASDVVRIGGRTWSVQYVGRRVHRLFWRDPDGGGVHWITNTLTDELDGAEMYALAKSLERR
ncbi:unannotated protein [freshwater metagenome]|uniref:Unannotated protein n=1 Tax=freshwater metagenome TaxID=449393 RepID=A0A6J7IY96_9ZZZZ